MSSMEHIIRNKRTTYKHMQIPLHSIGPKGKSSSAAGSLKLKHQFSLLLYNHNALCFAVGLSEGMHHYGSYD
uniref:Uncharacterized protein n=2 Tax=Arion vulgaris TaxID=1028688 RepID=A0A0B7BJY4_9EUPU